jgi:DNA polymerase I-like protein with 3'-5' exonuclease and polymerase domains
MKILVADLETTVSMTGDRKDNSPFHPENKLVSAHWAWVDGNEPQSSVFCHNEKETPDSPDAFRAALEQADVLVCHNAKFDVQWLKECGFPLPKQIYCTMIGEYIFSRAQGRPLGLKDTAERRDVTRKRSDVTEQYFKQGIGFEAMPLDTMLEYAETDVTSCREIYEAQQQDLEKPSNVGLRPVFDLMNEMLEFLVEIESNGIRIDLDALAEVEKEFVAEKAEIEGRLERIISDVMGDRPINLNSGADMSMVVYSRRVKDKSRWKEVFNIGTTPSGKPLPPARMSVSAFGMEVRKQTDVIKRQVAHQCSGCEGQGKIRKMKKDGTPYKNPTKCPECGGSGVVYEDTGKVAGLKLVPKSPMYCSIHGFKTDKTTIKKLIAQAEGKGNETAAEFLKGISRLNAINTYLSSFVHGIQMWTRPDGFLHANFNQTTTRTGRLSSSNPNFQNQPKGGKFPVRRAVISRFEGGQILEADFSGLEFRVAGELSRDGQIIADILDGKDVHRDERQAAKAYTFAPLYGGMGANEPPHVQRYFEEYFGIYDGLSKWHRKLMDGVLEHGIVRIPSGREFAFPNAQRLRSGRITNATNVVNYPVQSFATADIVPLACIRALRLILTVHDSIVVDVHPDELDQVKNVLKDAMLGVKNDLIERFEYEPVLPFDIEIEAGTNWMTMADVPVD